MDFCAARGRHPNAAGTTASCVLQRSLPGVTLIAVEGFVYWPLPQTDGITRENFRRIQLGMSQAKVEAILGPPGEYRSGPVKYELLTPVKGNEDQLSTSFEGQGQSIWMSDQALVGMEFERTGRVIGGPSLVRLAGKKEPQGQSDNLLWRAKRQWHRWFPEKPEVQP